ncbi:MAG: GEVED domain-containing protein [Caldilineaceae bacterium]
MYQTRTIRFFATAWIGLLLACLLMGDAAVFANTPSESAIQIYRVANFQINYRDAGNPGACNPGDGAFQPWSAEAQAAMNHVVDILDDLLNSTPTIVIDACLQTLDPGSGTLAFAGENGNLTQADVAALPVANRTYPMALANAITGVDQNGAAVEVVATANAAVAWDFCTVGCTVAAGRTDFVSTMVHEVLHGLGFSMSFDQSQDDPSVGVYSDPPAVIDDYVIQTAGGAKLLDLPNNSAALLSAMQAGSGAIAYNGPNTLAVNGGATPFIFAPNPFQQGSSMSHWDDDHPTNLGRMMNSATGDGPSARVVDAITLMVLKDIGWSVNDAADFGDAALAAYGNAQHINSPSFVGHMKLGASFSTEAAPAAADASDDGVTRPAVWTADPNGGQITANVVSNQAGATGCLSGWIDWSGDGDFGDADEQIAAMRPATVGNLQVTFNIPASANTTTTYNGRIRLIPDWDGDGACDDQVALTPAGGVLGGEVEDYQWKLSGGSVVTPPVVKQRLFLPLVQKGS